MADLPPGSEPNATQFNNIGPIGGQVDLGLDGIDSAAASVATLTGNLGELQKVLRGFGTMSGNALNSMLKDLKKNADAANQSIGGLGTGGGMAFGSGGGGSAGAYGGSGSWFQQAVQQVTAGTRLGGGLAAAGSYLSGTMVDAQGNFSPAHMAGGLAMGGLRFLRDRIGTTRNLAISSGIGFGMAARQQGADVGSIMSQVSRLPGGIMGDPSDLLGLFSQAPMYGASYNFGGRAGGQGVRAGGMFRGLAEAQALNPGATVQSLMQNVGGYASNTGAQQQAIMMTGGAFSIIGAGGRQKSISEWAESILRWFEGLRPGNKRNTGFNYGELMAQYFPGSNIDAWFNVNQVPQGMRDYWWTYALQKASKSDTTSGAALKIEGDPSNVAFQRLRAQTELTRTEFNLGGALTPHYLKKEQANVGFNRAFGAAQTAIIPKIADALGGLLDKLPDTIEDVLFNLIEMLASGGFSGPRSTGMGELAPSAGDIGDTYGPLGGTGLSGLSLNMKSKLGPMMKANPRLKVTSGLRDTAMQKRLKGKGYNRVSGKPSSHTRGDAADLGPASEYPWIMANAGRFGLKSGAKAGEPWHVGVGDLNLPGILELLGASSGGGDIIGMLSGLMSSMFGLSGTDGGAAPLDFDKFSAIFGSFSGLGSATGGTPTAGIGAGGGVTGGAGAGVAGGSTYAEFFTQVLQGMNVAASPGNLTKLAAVVKGEGRTGHFNPFNSIGGDFPNKLNSAGVENYPDWATGVSQTIKLLSQANTAGMRQNLMAGKSYDSWLGAVSGFYESWGGHFPAGIREGSAAMLLTQPVGDMDSMSYRAMGGTSSRTGALVQFNNTFVIGGSGNTPGGGLDVRRTVTMVADRLEDEMNKRLARTN